MTRCNAEGISPFQAFIRRWSQFQRASDDLKTEPSIYRIRSNEKNDVNAAHEFDELVPQIGMVLFILKHVKVDPGILGTPDSVREIQSVETGA